MTAEKDVQVARKKGRGVAVIWAMPERKHFFLKEVVSFPDEKTIDSTRLQMLRGKQPSTTEIAAVIPIVK